MAEAGEWNVKGSGRKAKAQKGQGQANGPGTSTKGPPELTTQQAMHLLKSPRFLQALSDVGMKISKPEKGKGKGKGNSVEKPNAPKPPKKDADPKQSK